jgi:alanyl-tRNA synthetase
VNTIGIVMDKSPFYAEAGGQVPDSGEIVVQLADGRTVSLEVLDVQTYGGYILHTCAAMEESDSMIGVAVGASATATVDYDKRRKVAPNHTMTHVLNFALREVLGNDVDQKGSLVSEEKFRFDFSFNRAVASEELAKIETIVNDVIRAELEVHNEVVPLKEAMNIMGLRAVFGETYPDPVRVVSVGPSVKDLLSDPKKPTWMGHSIEFCGGTHLSNTRDATAFVITEETAVAKGIRRVSGVTGAEATAAQSLAKELSHQVSDLSGKVTALASGKAQGDALELESQIAALRVIVDESAVSQSVKSGMRSTLEQAGKEIAAAKNKQMMALVDVGIQKAKEQAAELSKKGAKSAVLTVDIGSDSKAIKRAVEEIKKVSYSCSSPCSSTHGFLNVHT